MPLSGLRVLITGGATRNYLDEMRFVTNKATGALGALLAERALARGAEVTYVVGVGGARPQAPDGTLRIVEIETIEDLVLAMQLELVLRRQDIVIHNMAVSDFRVADRAEGKVSSDAEVWTVRMVRAPKVVSLIKRLDAGVFLVGFKLEVGADREELRRRAHAWRERYCADLVVANELHSIERGRHTIAIIDRSGKVVATAEGKPQVAEVVLDAVQGHARRRGWAK